MEGEIDREKTVDGWGRGPWLPLSDQVTVLAGFMEKHEKKPKKEVQKTIEKIKEVIVAGEGGMDNKEPLGRWLNREYKRHLKDKESWLIKADEKGGLGGRKCKGEAKDAGKRETEWGRLLVWWQGLIHCSKERTQKKQSEKTVVPPPSVPPPYSLTHGIQVLLKILAYCDKVHYFP
ncbi:hypothetical protein GOODEAATRI_034312 [Goodea atripinnis]|uniref:Uncharacterized protein n=1 Tax=Goodea atripinnis TaxID=208336 RepID=A0ABV0MXG7_9TELE